MDEREIPDEELIDEQVLLQINGVFDHQFQKRVNFGSP